MTIVNGNRERAKKSYQKSMGYLLIGLEKLLIKYAKSIDFINFQTHFKPLKNEKNSIEKVVKIKL